jgi:hypothetical protein
MNIVKKSCLKVIAFQRIKSIEHLLLCYLRRRVSDSQDGPAELCFAAQARLHVVRSSTANFIFISAFISS